MPVAPASADTVLNVVTAGDQNMVDYINDYLGPKFEAGHPGVTVRAVGTGPGDAGSLKIFEKLDAEAKAGTDNWDIDVAVVHQRGAAQMLGDDLLAKYRDDIPTGKLVTRDTADNALGTDVTGYVMPMFHSQIAIAYNPDMVRTRPRPMPSSPNGSPIIPKRVRLQRHQGRHVRRRLRHGLGRGLYRRRGEARKRPLRSRR